MGRLASPGVLRLALVTVWGALMGVVLSGTGFADATQVRAMFLLQDLRLLLTFAGAAALMAGVRAIRLGGLRPSAQRPVPGALVGAVIFGAGWALSTACPAAALTMLGGGAVGAAWLLVGMVAGTWAYRQVHRRFFRWPAPSCADD